MLLGHDIYSISLSKCKGQWCSKVAPTTRYIVNKYFFLNYSH